MDTGNVCGASANDVDRRSCCDTSPSLVNLSPVLAESAFAVEHSPDLDLGPRTDQRRHYDQGLRGGHFVLQALRKRVEVGQLIGN